MPTLPDPFTRKWAPPAELTLPVPRPVRSRPVVRGLQAAILMLTIVVIAATWVCAAGPDIKLSILRSRGVATDAIVTKKYFEAKDGDKNNLEYRLAYRFHDSKTHITDHVDTVAYQIYFETSVDDKVPVVYDPQLPERVAFDFDDSLHSTNPWTVLLIMTGLFMAFAAALHGLVMFIFESYSRLQKHLLKWGTPVQAVIIKTATPDHGTEVTYTFVDSRGKKVTGIHTDLPAENDAEYNLFMKKFSNNPCVLYDPQDSSKNMLYPPVWARIAKRN